MKRYGRMHRAETMYAIIYPYRDALKQDCQKKVQFILMVNRWINPWHALQELSKEIPFSRRQKLRNPNGRT